MRTFIFDILGYPLLVLLQFSWLQLAEAEVLCTGLPNGGRQEYYCPVSCCLRQEGSHYSYYCCGSAEGPGPGWIYRERSEGRNNRYVPYSNVRIDWWNSLLISLALSIILSVLLSLLCCFICARRRR